MMIGLLCGLIFMSFWVWNLDVSLTRSRNELSNIKTIKEHESLVERYEYWMKYVEAEIQNIKTQAQREERCFDAIRRLCIRFPIVEQGKDIQGFYTTIIDRFQQISSKESWGSFSVLADTLKRLNVVIWEYNLSIRNRHDIRRILQITDADIPACILSIRNEYKNRFPLPDLLPI